jgi:hypothetical protein
MILNSNEAAQYREEGKEYYFLQPRASMLGKTESEIYKYFTTRQEMDEEHIAILSANSGTALHRLVLAQQFKAGELDTAEKFVHNKEYNFTGHIDAVSKNMGLGDVKTVARGVYNRIKREGPLASHITQVNAYMATTGQKDGYIQYIMREDPTQQIVFKLEFDSQLFERDMEKIKRVQARVQSELAEGKLTYKQLRQGTSAEMDAAESAKSHEKLVNDTSKMEDLIDYYLHYQKKEDKARGNNQKISFASRYSNRAINPQGRREDQNTIEGMKHGWFGSQRKETMPFGSQYQVGNFHNLKDITDNDVADVFRRFKGEQADKKLGLNGNVFLDTETLDLKPRPHSVLEVSWLADSKLESVFVQQKTNELGEFHETGALGELKRKINLDVTKPGEVLGYAENIFEDYPGIDVKAHVNDTAYVNAALEKVFHNQKRLNQNIITANGAFDNEHLLYLMGKRPIPLSKDMMRAKQEASRHWNTNKTLLDKGKITEDELFDRAVSIQKRKAYLALMEAERGGHHIDATELFRTINAMAQQKGYIPKTGNFGTGASVEMFAKHILKDVKALHDSGKDIYATAAIAPHAAKILHQLEAGEDISKMPKWFQAYAKDWTENLSTIYDRQIGKKIANEIRMKGTVENIMPENRFQYSFSKVDEKALFHKNLKGNDEILNLLKKHPNAIPNVKPQNIAGAAGVKALRFGALTTAGLLIFAATKNAFQFSGRDDDANTVEALRHGGWAEHSRRLHSDFGSGYRMEDYHNDPKDPSSTNYLPLGIAAAGAGAAKYYWNKPVGDLKVDELGYLGRLHADKLNSEVLGRTQATFGDVALAGVKRLESAAGGLFRSFGVSELISSESYKELTYTVDITQQNARSFAQYMNQLVNRDLRKEGIEAVTFAKGKLYFQKQNVTELVPGNFSLLRMSHDLNQNESMTQMAKAMTRMQGINYIDPTKFSFLPYGGEGALKGPAAHKAHAYFRETLTKYLNLMRHPLDALSEVIPDAPITKAIKEKVKGLPIGIGTEDDLIGPTRKVIGTHALKLGGMLGLAYFGYGTLDHLVSAISPDSTVAGKAGLTGLGAEAIRTAHQTYARFSDVTGMTHLRDHVEAAAPGMEGWKAVAGLGLSGAVAGGALAIGEDLITEAASKGRRYEQFLLSREATEEMPELLKKLPGFGNKYTKVGKYARMGGLAGAVLALPFAIAGFGADKSYEELEQEYSGEKEVAVRKGRFWEASMTPWGGGKIDYYRPNWYRRLIDDPVNQELMGGDRISPFGKLVRDLVDPYWLEKRRYSDQPYPVAGPDGSAFGMFGPLYEATLGRVLKAPAVMHRDELEAKLGDDVLAPSEPTSLIRRQWSSFLEAAGLRGFGLGALKESITGNKDIEVYSPELASSAAMNSIAARFHEMQLGGGFLTTEAVRRVLQREEVGAVERLNPLRNNMPTWMPGQGFHTNFQEGDPFTKIADGYYRLPGEGFASRYEDLKGMNPENYPDIYKYKILADVAHSSQEFREVKGRLDNRVLTPEEMTVFNQVEEQLQARNESNENFRDPAMYDTLLGNYSAILTDVARNNPLEHLIPFSPGHKFLPGQDPTSRYEESIYAKEFKNWSSPFDDFIKPAANVALNNLGLKDTPGDVEYARQLEDHFDKIQYLKHMREARFAEAGGDQGAANLHRGYADQTMSGLDPYMDSNALLSLIPKRERPYFERFLQAGEDEKTKILGLTSSSMRDIYLAQWDKQAMIALESGEVEVPRDQRAEMLAEIKSRAHQVRARRKAQIQDFQNSEAMPEDNWSGWDGRVDLEDVKMKYLINEGRDYHYYGLWKDRMNAIARRPYVTQAAENLKFAPQTYRSKYAEAYETARGMGVVNPEVAIQPGLETGYNLEVQMHRNEERREVLRDLGYII